MTLPTGVRLHWREAGDPASPAVVWIHGGSVEDSSFMLPDLEPFLPRIRALFPDTRGHGLSQRFERVEDYTYAGEGPATCSSGSTASGSARPCGAAPRWARRSRSGRRRTIRSACGRWCRSAGRRSRRAERSSSGGRAIGRSSPRAASTSSSTPISGCAWGRTRSQRLKARPERYAEMTGRLARALRRLAPRAARRDLLAHGRGSPTAPASGARSSIIAGAEDSFPTAEMSRARGRDHSRRPSSRRRRAARTSRIAATAPRCSR